MTAPYIGRVKILFGAAVGIFALTASACGSGHSSTAPTVSVAKLSATAPIPALAKLSPAVRRAVEREIRLNKHPSKYSTVNRIEVYGPGSLSALEAATDPGSSGPPETPQERTTRYYVTVLYGRFVCVMCHGLWTSPPRGTVETFVWSPTPVGETAFGLMHHLPRAVSRLHRLIRIKLR
jgi:hypothetical protein